MLSYQILFRIFSPHKPTRLGRTKPLSALPRGCYKVPLLSNLSIHLLPEQLTWVKGGGPARPFPYRLHLERSFAGHHHVFWVIGTKPLRIFRKVGQGVSKLWVSPVLLRASGGTCLEILSSIFPSRTFSLYDSLGCDKDSQAYSYSGNFPYGGALVPGSVDDLGCFFFFSSKANLCFKTFVLNLHHLLTHACLLLVFPAVLFLKKSGIGSKPTKT